MIYIASGLIDPRTAKPRRSMIRAAVRGLVDRMLDPVPFREAVAAVMRGAHIEQAQVLALNAARAADERLIIARRADADRLAAAYGYDAADLYFQYERRTAGSFTTTLDGAPSERDRYFRAWKTAVARERATQLIAAE